MSFKSFSLSIVVDLFAAKIAGYTFIWTTYENHRHILNTKVKLANT